MKKILLTLLLLFIFTIQATFPAAVFAQSETFTRTLIPEVNKDNFKSNADCRFMITRFEDAYFFQLDNAAPDNPTPEATADLGSLRRFQQAIDYLKTQQVDNFLETNFENLTRNDVLGCAIVTGRIKMFYLSMFISYAMNMIAILGGSISMIFIMVGGYQYVIGGITQSTDEGKGTIINAIIGLLVSSGAWIIVNVILSLITS
jgi:hypothetical protein